MMTPEAQKLAIAEACGWRVRAADVDLPPDFRVWERGGAGVLPDCLPDYLADLNAIHEAEKVLRADAWMWSRYCSALATKCGRLYPYDSACAWDVEHATAAQRAEAFLRCTGRWIEN